LLIDQQGAIVLAMKKFTIRVADRDDMDRLGEPAPGDLEDVELSGGDKSLSIPSQHPFRESEFETVRYAFWITVFVFFVVGLFSPEKIEYKEEIYPLAESHMQDRFVVFDLTVAELVSFVALDVSAIRNGSGSSVGIPLTFVVDSTLKSHFEIVNQSRREMQESLSFESGESRSQPFFGFSSAVSEIDLVEVTFNISTDFSELTAFAMRSSSGSTNAQLFIEAGGLLFAILAGIMTVLFYFRIPGAIKQFRAWCLIGSLVASGLCALDLSTCAAFIVRICLIWEDETVQERQVALSMSLLLWALFRELPIGPVAFASAAAVSAGHLWLSYRFSSTLNGNLFAHFSLVLTLVAAVVDAIWGSTSASERFLFGDFLFQAANLTAGAMLIFLLRPIDLHSGFAVISPNPPPTVNL
jgi:hypothetical protein